MKVKSTAKNVNAIEIIDNIVYIKTNVNKLIEKEEDKIIFDGWEYDEEQMPIADYFEKQKSDIDYLAIMGGINL